MSIKKYSNIFPKIYPIGGEGSPVNIHRVQDLTPTGTLNRERRYEVGREDNISSIKSPSDVTYDLTVAEHGSFDFWTRLANLADNAETVTLDNFSDAWFDIAGPVGDDASNIEGTEYYPNLRVDGFTLDIPNTEDVINRTFSLVGEKDIYFREDNKYLIYVDHTATGPSDDTVDLSSKTPIEDPDLERYILRISRLRSGEVTTLETDEYSYDDVAEELTINDVATDDLFKIWYTSSTAPDSVFSLNDSDPAGIKPYAVSVYMCIPNSAHPNEDDYVYKLQSCTIDVSLTREDDSEIGNEEVIQRSVPERTVSISLGKLYSDEDILQVLRGVDSNYGRLDIDELSNDITFIVKVFDKSDKSNFRYAFIAENLSPTEKSDSVSVQENVSRDWTLEGSNLTITEDPTVVGI